MEYRVEVYDTWGRRVAAFDDVPLLEATRTTPDERDMVRGLLPHEIATIGAAHRVRVLVDGALFCDAPVVSIGPHWGDTRKLILDRYVPLHTVIEARAERAAHVDNPAVSQAHTNQEISAIVKSAINEALGPLHYTVAHGAYPEGAQQENVKFLGRKTTENELEVGGISEGQWVGAPRIDASAAYAKDGDTIAGLVVDGEPWPDLRLIMIDAEETSRNSHAIKRHPEVAGWSDARYDASGYKRAADAAKAFLQALIDEEGVEYIELNPHKNAFGEYDDRIDAFGRYIGMAFGGGLCFNAALFETGHADVYLYEQGRYHAPELALKDFFSYRSAHEDSVTHTGVTLSEFDASGGVLEIVAALAYAGGGYVFTVDEAQAVHFGPAAAPKRVYFHDPLRTSVQYGADARDLANLVFFQGNPFTGSVSKTYSRSASIGAYGPAARRFEYFSISRVEDADRLIAGLLADLAYPTISGAITFFDGNAEARVGDLIEVRGAPVRRLEPELADEWDGRFSGKLVARVCRVVHKFSGKQATTTLHLTSPLRSVARPFSYLVRSQPAASTLFEFRLDDARVGLDMGFHLD
ncbi:MAG TPA: hypothetical protein PKI11_02365 [Candidatus Hydrogenedentes bacterium]|nr:hypothetical protein [Candidatus Hydrogenedentota bacterium]